MNKYIAKNFIIIYIILCAVWCLWYHRSLNNPPPIQPVGDYPYSQEMLCNAENEDQEIYRLVYFINPNMSMKDYLEFVDAIENNFLDTGLNKKEFIALCAKESSLNKKAISATEDYGICQINVKTYKYFSKSSNKEMLFNISYNIKIAAKLLRHNKDIIDTKYKGKSEDFKKIVLISSYNKGIGLATFLADNGNLPDKYTLKVLGVE